MTHLSAVYYSHLPDQTQTMLLKACLSEDTEQSLQYWNNWINQNHYNKPTFRKSGHLLPQVFDHLDFGSQRLLSLLYKKISSAKVNDPFISELKGYYRYIWVRNHIFRNQLEEIVKLLAADNILYVIIKGIPAIEVFYKDWGVRSVLDIDLAIHPEHWAKAIVTLRNNGWKSKFDNKNPEWILGGLVHSCTMIKGDCELDLHIKFLQLPLNKATEEKFWSGIQSYKPLHTMLKPEHQLLCSFMHGIQGKDEATRTVTDSIYILRNHQIDWNEVIAIAQEGNLLIPLIVFIDYLHKEQFISIPEEIVNRIYSQSITPFEVSFFRLFTKPYSSNGLNLIKIKFIAASILTPTFYGRIKLLLNNYRFEWGTKSIPGFIFALIWVGFSKLFFPNQKIENRKIPFLSSQTSSIS